MASKRTVLVIDDEIDFCLLLKSYFLRKNYEVYLSHTLQEGVAFLNSIQPDVLFLDNNLPDGVGWSVAPTLAADYPKMYINLISAFHPVAPAMPTSTNYSIIEKPLRLSDLDKQLAEMESNNMSAL
jgi:DNA-binding NtrC family response regulator